MVASDIIQKEMFTSKITQRGQATIPSAVRDKLDLHTGDSIVFDLKKNGEVVLHKAEPIDILFLQSLNSSLNEEWNSEADSGAYDDL